jgi:hypothetical protein
MPKKTVQHPPVVIDHARRQALVAVIAERATRVRRAAQRPAA